MSIDFKRLESGDDFELLCRDVLESGGAEIISEPSRGPDQKKDMIVDIATRDPFGHRETTRYVVQCKHKAKSGRSVRESDLGDIRSACKRHAAGGYFLITSTMPSQSVSADLEAISSERYYKTRCWDRRRLEKAIEQLENAHGIIKRYRLKEPLENIFSFMKRVLVLEAGMPHTLVDTVEEAELRGFIFESRDERAGDPNVKPRIGYFCTEAEFDSALSEEVKKRHSLRDLYIVQPGEGAGGISMSPDEFYSHIQSYKDRWYQAAIIRIARGAAINPTVIRLVNSAIRPLPYPAQPETIAFLDDLMKKEDLDPLLTVEACGAVADLKIIGLKQSVFDVLRRTPKLRNRLLDQSREHAIILTVLTERVISSFAKLEEGCVEYESRMKELFFSTSDLQFKALMIHYFTCLKLRTLDVELRRLKEEQGGATLLPAMHGIAYNSQRIGLWPNMVPWRLERYIENHFKAMDRNEVPRSSDDGE